MGSTYRRSFVKGIVWESISSVLIFLGLLVIYGNARMSLKTTVILTAIKIPFYFIHERIWKKIKWGKIPVELYKGKINGKKA